MTHNAIPHLCKREIGNATLYLADCRAIAADLPKARLVVTDPPYRLTSGGMNGGGMNGGWMSDYSNNGAPVACDIDWPEIMALCYSLGAVDSDAYVMANDKNLIPAGMAAGPAGFSIHNILVWDKVNATANRWYMKNCEYVLYLWKGHASKINNASSKQLIRLPQIDESNHPTEKPVELMAHYIENSSKPGDLVTDPFMGSGTTGVACAKLGRRFIGVEIDPGHFETACERIIKTRPQGDLLTTAAAPRAPQEALEIGEGAR